MKKKLADILSEKGLKLFLLNNLNQYPCDIDTNFNTDLAFFVSKYLTSSFVLMLLKPVSEGAIIPSSKIPVAIKTNSGEIRGYLTDGNFIALLCEELAIIINHYKVGIADCHHYGRSELAELNEKIASYFPDQGFGYELRKHETLNLLRFTQNLMHFNNMCLYQNAEHKWPNAEAAGKEIILTLSEERVTKLGWKLLPPSPVIPMETQSIYSVNKRPHFLALRENAGPTKKPCLEENQDKMSLELKS